MPDIQSPTRSSSPNGGPSWHTALRGQPVWAPIGSYGWAMATIVGLGRKYAVLEFNSGRRGKRPYLSLRWRRPELKGKDKPPKPIVHRAPKPSADVCTAHQLEEANAGDNSSNQ